MPAQSQQQQKLFGLALAVKRGEVSASEVSDEVNAIVDRMSEKDIEDFAGTSHKGLPKKVEAQIREMVREIMRERAMKEAELPKAMIPNNIKAKLNMAIDKIKDTNLTYNQKLQVIGKIIDSLGIDKKELVKMSTRLRGTLESVTEGKKVFKVNPQIGKVKYSISSHDGVKKHKDGSDFFDIETFKNKVDLEKAIKNYTSKGFQMESVNESASRTAMEIGGYTGLNKNAVQKFVDDNNLDIEKVFQFVKKGKLSDRMEMVSAVAGKPGNPIQKKIIKMFGESVNEGASTEEKKIVMMAIKKIAKYRNVSLDYAVGDVIRAAEELERDIQKGKVK